jgi:hypothetical protein
MDQAFIARPLSLSDKGHLLPDFYSGATGLPGRFSDGFLLRRLHLTEIPRVTLGELRDQGLRPRPGK